MYGFGSTPGSAPRKPGDAGADQHGAEPQRHARVEPALEQIEGQRPGRDEEDEDPDRPVVEPVIELVALADLALRGVFDRDSVHGFFVRFLRRFDAGVLVLDVGGRLAFDRRV